MYRGSKKEMLCEHVEIHSSSTRKKCSSPQGASSPRRDPKNTKVKQEAHIVDLISQLGENQARIKSLTERGNRLNLSMQQGIAEARHMMFGSSDSSSSSASPDVERQNCTAGRPRGVRPNSRSGKAPWHPDPETESDDGRRDTSYLTEDGKQVVQKQYVPINGHWALIAYRKELHEVDPYLLAKLQDKRKKDLEKAEAKERKGKGKRPVRHSEFNNIIINNEEDSKMHRGTSKRSEEKAIEKWRSVSQAPRSETRFHDDASEPSSPRPSRGSRGIIIGKQQAERKISQESKGVIHEEKNKTHLPPTRSGSQKAYSPVLPYPSTSFRARAGRNGFSPTSYEQEPAQAESSGDPVAARGLIRINRRTWVERFTEDVTYCSTDSDSDADSVVTVLKIPVPQSEKKISKSTSYENSRSQTYGIGDEEDLDIWLKIADAE